MYRGGRHRHRRDVAQPRDQRLPALRHRCLHWNRWRQRPDRFLLQGIPCPAPGRRTHRCRPRHRLRPLLVGWCRRRRLRRRRAERRPRRSRPPPPLHAHRCRRSRPGLPRLPGLRQQRLPRFRLLHRVAQQHQVHLQRTGDRRHRADRCQMQVWRDQHRHPRPQRKCSARPRTHQDGHACRWLLRGRRRRRTQRPRRILGRVLLRSREHEPRRCMGRRPHRRQCHSGQPRR